MDSLIAIGSAAAIVYGIIALYEIGMGLGTMDMTKVHSWAMDMYFETSADDSDFDHIGQISGNTL